MEGWGVPRIAVEFRECEERVECEGVAWRDGECRRVPRSAAECHGGRGGLESVVEGWRASWSFQEYVE